MVDMNDVAGDARAKSLSQILHDIDSIKEYNDSIGTAYYADAKRFVLRTSTLNKDDSAKAVNAVASDTTPFDSVFERLKPGDQQVAVKGALSSVQGVITDMEMKMEYVKYLHRNYRRHKIEAIGKFTLAFSCLIFFFIGAPLGAIIRKGGLGVPVIVSVLVFIVYFIFDNSGFKMARDGQWNIWFGKLISTIVLAPIATFFTYKANKDSTVFNLDLYKNLAMRALGLREKRHIFRKEVIIEDPQYEIDVDILLNVNQEIETYSEQHKLYLWPNPIKVFFQPGDDQEIEHINSALETAIEDLSYTRDKLILSEINNYPIVAVRAHTRPFRKKWMNAVTGLFLPAGIFFYFRMIRFRLRLYKDLRTIRQTSDRIIPRALEISTEQKSITELL